MTNPQQPKYLILLAMLASTFWIMCIVCQYRLIPFGPWGDISTADLPYPLLCIMFDITAEIYGYRTSRRLLWMALVSIFAFGIGLILITHLPMPEHLHQSANLFNQTFQHIPRLMAFNTFALILGQYVNVYVFARLQVAFQYRHFAVRSVLSTIVGDCLTFSVALIGDYWGMMHFTDILAVIGKELLLMYVIASALSIPGSIVVGYLRKVEPTFTSGITFNPFK